jgi:hypothetical protein
MSMLRILSIGILVVLAACQSEYRDEIHVMDNVCLNLADENHQLLDQLINSYMVTYHQDPPSSLTDLQFLNLARENYLGDFDASALLIFSDSVMARYQTLACRDENISSSLADLRKEIRNAGDTLSRLHFFLHSLTAERILLEGKAIDHRINIRHRYVMPLYLDKKVFSAGDTVRVGINFSQKDFLDADTVLTERYDFSKIICSNESGEAVSPAVLRSGPIFILSYYTPQKGEYSISGEIRKWKNATLFSSMKVCESFKVN